MDALWVQLIRGRDYPDLIIADNVMYRYYLNALQAIQRIGSENGAPDMAEAGFRVFEIFECRCGVGWWFPGFFW